jgi:succinate dehydrogenase / fumarate reductase iron-sulfur subunit
LIKASAYTFRILRYDVKKPESEPRFATYRINVIPGLTILSVLLRIRDEIDGTLSFRCSCRSAVCGSCAMVINGKIDLACRTQVATFDTDTIILEPLPNLEVIRDLVVDMTPFWQMYEKVQPYLIRKSPVPEKEILQSEEDRKRIDQFVNCILCACCYGACPVL